LVGTNCIRLRTVNLNPGAPGTKGRATLLKSTKGIKSIFAYFSPFSGLWGGSPAFNAGAVKLRFIMTNIN
jgi:hypothetical protein